jgi:galactokinase
VTGGSHAAKRPLHPLRVATRLFARAFGGLPAVGASAPGRVNLIGEHLDYNGGPVLPVALDRRTVVVASPSDRWEFVSDLDGNVRSHIIDAPMQRDWTDYLVGVIRELQALGVPLPGARIAVATSLPVGAGLSSSAALTVAAGKALSLLAGRHAPPEFLAELAFRAEHDQVGVRCGHMDQTISAHARSGTALFFDTATGRHQLVPMPEAIWIIETGTVHRLTGGELNHRRRECEEALERCRAAWPGLHALAELQPADLPAAERLLPGPLTRRVRHVVTEVVRTRAAAGALSTGDTEELGRLLQEGHASLRDDYESTIGEADLIVDAACRHGAYGARLTGAGWGGAVVAIAPAAAVPQMLDGVNREFRDRYGRPPAAWRSKAAAGVRREVIRA